MSHTPIGGTPGRVLVTDGELKHTLGIARTLAARGHEVHVVASTDRAPAVHSRAVHRSHRAPRASLSGYEGRLLEIAGDLAPASMIPVGNAAVAATDRLRERLAGTIHFALPPRESLVTANDKARTAALARSLGIATPAERAVTTLDEARAALAEFGAPLVLKSGQEEGRKALRYVRTDRDVAAAFAAVRQLSRGAVLAQRYIPGPGWGVSALYWQGAARRLFVHRRIREWPPSGGASACAESVPSHPALERAGVALLDALRWHGVAMVEFKGDPGSGTLALMEINAKFWGSHDLALAAGVDFPNDLVTLLEGRELPPQPAVRRVRFSWPLDGDLWHGLFRPAALPLVIWDAVWPGVAHTFRIDDPMPHLYELVQWVRSAPGAWREFRDMR